MRCLSFFFSRFLFFFFFFFLLAGSIGDLRFIEWLPVRLWRGRGRKVLGSSPYYLTLMFFYLCLSGHYFVQTYPRFNLASTRTTFPAIGELGHKPAGVVEVAWRFPSHVLSRDTNKKPKLGHLQAVGARSVPMEICGPPSPPLRAAWKSLLEVRDRVHAANLGGPRPDRRREAPHLLLWRWFLEQALDKVALTAGCGPRRSTGWAYGGYPHRARGDLAIAAGRGPSKLP